MKRRTAVFAVILLILVAALTFVGCAETTYTVKFEVNGGTAISDVTVKHTEAIDWKAPTPVKTGYTFAGWYTDQANDKPFVDGTLDGNVTLYATWTINVYTVTFDYDGGTGVETSRQIEYGNAIGTLPAATQTGFEFGGWYFADDTQATAQSIVFDNVTLKARWLSPEEVLVAFDYNGGTGDVENTVLKVGEVYTLLPEATKEGYDFVGWTLDGEPVTADTVVEKTVAHTLVAQWEAKEYVVTFDYNGGKGNVENKTVKYGETYGQLPEATRDGYNFKGWTLNGKVVTADTVVGETEAHTLTAQWEEAVYTVTFDSNGGTAIAPKTGLHFGDLISKPADPVLDGYDFVAWLTEDGKTWDFDNDTVKGDMLLYANYTEEEGPVYYRVAFYTNGGTNVSSVFVSAGETVERPADPVLSLHVLAAWCTDAALGNEYDFATPVTGDLDLYAKWAPKEYINISTYEELNAISDLNGKYRLVNDIDFAGKNFVMIGVNASTGVYKGAFTGIFDGNGHVFKNVTIANRASIYAGVFVSIKNGVIRNLGVENLNLTINRLDAKCVGGLVGDATNSVIEDCFVTGHITFNTPNFSERDLILGGLVAHAEDCTVRNCYTNVELSAECLNADSDFDDVRIGGLVAEFEIDTNSSSMIENCYSAGSITVNTEERCYVGGLVGSFSGGERNIVSLRNCFSTCTIVATLNTGNHICYFGHVVYSASGIFGYSDLYALKGDDIIKVTAGTTRTWFNRTAGNAVVPLSVMNTAAFQRNYVGLSDEHWNFSHGHLPVLSWQTPPAATDNREFGITFDTSALDGFTVDDQTVDYGGWVKEPNVPNIDGRVLEGWFNGDKKWDFLSDIVTDHITLKAVWIDAIKITTVAQLNAVRNDLTASYILGNDIDLGGVAFTPIGWEGTTITPFTGIFNGNGYTIKNFTINGSAYTNAYFGLFAITDDGAEIKNLGVTGVKMSGYTRSYYGAMIGYARRGTVVDSCFAEVTMTMSGGTIKSFIGGFVGGERDATFTNCYADVKINVTYNGNQEDDYLPFVGGFSSGTPGDNSTSTFVNCYSTGDITFTVVGESSGSLCIGGFLGRLEDECKYVITSCFSNVNISVSGLAQKNNHINGFIGGMAYGSNAVITNCYVTMEQVISLAGTVVRAQNTYGEKKSESQLFAVDFLKSIGFAPDRWVLQEGKLPKLQQTHVQV